MLKFLPHHWREGLYITPSRSQLLNAWARSGLPQTLPLRLIQNTLILTDGKIPRRQC